MLDSVRKETDILKTFVDALDLSKSATVHNSRIEDFARNPQHREQYDIVTAMALAPLPTLLEYAIPLLKVGGVLLAFKGRSIEDEITAAENALKKLNAIHVVTHTKQSNGKTQTLCIIRKNEPTPAAFPRPQNKPRTNPL